MLTQISYMLYSSLALLIQLSELALLTLLIYSLTRLTQITLHLNLFTLLPQLILLN